MILFWNKKLEDNIKNRTISAKHFIIYSLFVIGSFSSMLRITRYPINTNAYDIANILSYVSIVIVIVQYIYCYKIVNGKDINIFLYAVIPLTFTLRFLYIIVLLIPLVLLNFIILRNFELDFNYWNIINFQIVNIIMNLFIAIHFVKILNRVYKNNLDMLV